MWLADEAGIHTRLLDGIQWIEKDLLKLQLKLIFVFTFTSGNTLINASIYREKLDTL